MVEESLARCSQLDTARTAAEQFRADFVFQIADLSAKRWLRRVQTLFGRNREAARLRDRNEIPQMSKFLRRLACAPCLAGMPTSLQSLFVFRNRPLD
jgi:hypothetical protein